MFKYESELQENNIFIVGGIDEAGRGPLAGPVVAACVIFDTRKNLPEAKDSKKLSQKQREILFDQIVSEALDYGVGIVDNETIDKINILQATYLAMKLAVEDCKIIEAEYLLVDHERIPNILIPQLSITKGDANSVCIAAASIIAKVTRDRMMVEYAKEYPAYAFEKHKGYGTKVHYQAINEFGITKIHRKTFLKRKKG